MIARAPRLVHIAAHMTARAKLLPVGFTPHRAMQLLLVFAVLAPIAKFMHGSALVVFLCSALAIVPLAGIMGGATEQLASRLGAGVGGLLNATFGNAAELIIALVALRSGLYDVVKASLTGSIIGNILLVLGVSMVAGGVRRERQKFDRSAAAASSTLLALAAIGAAGARSLPPGGRGRGRTRHDHAGARAASRARPVAADRDRAVRRLPAVAAVHAAHAPAPVHGRRRGARGPPRSRCGAPCSRCSPRPRWWHG